MKFGEGKFENWPTWSSREKERQELRAVAVGVGSKGRKGILSLDDADCDRSSTNLVWRRSLKSDYGARAREFTRRHCHVIAYHISPATSE